MPHRALLRARPGGRPTHPAARPSPEWGGLGSTPLAAPVCPRAARATGALALVLQRPLRVALAPPGAIPPAS
eukprot:4539854-Lingulodinium_polyedra.AAC.1